MNALNILCHFLSAKIMNNLKTNSLFADVADVGLRQAMLQHKEPIVYFGFRPRSHHDVMATRQQGDELRVMDICIGTFPFPRQPLFTLKALHIIYHYCPPGQVRHPSNKSNPHVQALSSSTVHHCSPLHSRSNAD